MIAGTDAIIITVQEAHNLVVAVYGTTIMPGSAKLKALQKRGLELFQTVEALRDIVRDKERVDYGD